MKQLELQENLKKFTHIDHCPIRNVISRFSGKWQLLVVCVLAENDSTRFVSLSRAIPDISPKVLTDTLKGLERDHLVERRVYAEVPPRVEYSLTPLGRSLTDAISPLISWALTHYAEVTA